jgi:hypothetical protein
LRSILDYFPCGYYKLTKDGEDNSCVTYNNLSYKGAGTKKISSLYEKGFIESFDNQEFFINPITEDYEYKRKYMYVTLLLTLLIFFILFCLV